MRKQDQDKRQDQKAAKTINFDKLVLEAVEIKARKVGTSVSNLVNLATKKMVMNDVKFHNEMSLYYAEQMAKHEFLRNRAAGIETKDIAEGKRVVVVTQE